MISFTPYELFIVVFGILGLPITLLVAILFAYMGYRAIPRGWKIGFYTVSAILIFAILRGMAMLIYDM